MRACHAATIRRLWPLLLASVDLHPHLLVGLLGPADALAWTRTRRQLTADKTTLRIMVVDDDPDACDILTHVLAHLGYSAVCIQDSVEALRHLQQEHFDLLLLDLVMPGLSGFDLLRAARAASSRAAVIAVSSYNEFRHKAMDMGFDSFVAKPVELAKLRPLLEGLQPTA